MINTKILGTTNEEIEEGAKILKNGGLVAFPTETVYGLGADALNPEAVGKVYSAKGRPSDNPMIVHIAGMEDLSKLTDRISRDMEILAEKFWPGPLTMVCHAKNIVPKVTTGGLDTVAVRFPSDPIALSLISKSTCPIAAPSANLSGKPSPTKVSHVIDDLYGRVDAIIEGKDCQVGIESTVLDMTEEIPMILRPGIVTEKEISEALNKEVRIDPGLREGVKGEFKPKAPGMKYKHYAPKAEMVIYRGDREKVSLAMAEEKMKRIKNGQKIEIIIFDETEPEKAAHEFFSRLRDCDKKGVDVILAAALKEEGVGMAVMNRMFKSAGYNIIEI